MKRLLMALLLAAPGPRIEQPAPPGQPTPVPVHDLVVDQFAFTSGELLPDHPQGVVWIGHRGHLYVTSGKDIWIHRHQKTGMYRIRASDEILRIFPLEQRDGKPVQHQNRNPDSKRQ